MEASTTSGKRMRGFSLMELMVVLAIVALLAGVAAPLAYNGIQRAKETAQKKNLSVLRGLIDDYYSDHGHYPASLEGLVQEGYLRALPMDQFTKQTDWVELEAPEGGIYEIRSNTKERSLRDEPIAGW